MLENLTQMQDLCKSQISVWQFIIPMVSLVCGAVLGVWVNNALKQPRLIPHGAFSGNFVAIRLMNASHRFLKFGPFIERGMARECRAILVLKESKEIVGQLPWRKPDGKLDYSINLASGEHAELITFTHPRDSETYYVFQMQDQEQIVPPSREHFTGSREFEIIVRDKQDVIVYRGPFTVTCTWNGRLSYQHGAGQGTF